MIVRPITTDDRPWIVSTLEAQWGAVEVVNRGRVRRADVLDGVVAERNGERCGLATYEVEDRELELVTINALAAGVGIGKALVEATLDVARARGCRRVWLTTTNDNLDAVRFYQRCGFRMVAVHVGGVDQARLLKPSIPEVGHNGIPVHDEIELAVALSD